MKEALAHEIEHQRSGPVRSKQLSPVAAVANVDATVPAPEIEGPHGVDGIRATEAARPTWRYRPLPHHGSLIALRAVARRYQRRMERELDEILRQAQLEHAA